MEGQRRPGETLLKQRHRTSETSSVKFTPAIRFEDTMSTEHQTPKYTTTISFNEIHAEKRKKETGGPGFIHTLEVLVKELVPLYAERLDELTLESAINTSNESVGAVSVMKDLKGYVQPQAFEKSGNADGKLATAKDIEALIRNDMNRCFPPCTEDGVMEGITLAEMQPILRLHGIFIEEADLGQTTFAYVRDCRDQLMTVRVLGEAMTESPITVRRPTEAWPFPSFMGPRCSAESSKRRGILDPKIGHLASLEKAMKEDEAEEDSLGAARLLWLNTKEERTTRREALLARAEDAVTALTDLKKGKAVLRLKEKTKALQDEEILQDDYEKILSEAEQKVMGFQLDKYGAKMLLAPAKKKFSRAEKNK